MTPPIFSLFFFFHLVICGYLVADPARAGLEILPPTQVPSMFRHRMCPLSGPRLLQHFEEGTFTAEVCKTAHLMCNPEVEISEEHGFLFPRFLRETAPSVSRTHSFNRSDIWAGRPIPSASLPNPLPFGALLPPSVLQRLPFSVDSLAPLMRMLRIPSGSPLAQHMKTTLSMCASLESEEEGNCVRSVEEMVQYATSRLGFPQEQLEILHSRIRSPSSGGVDEKEPEQRHETMIVTYATLKSEKGSAIICHEMTFPHAVFMCRVVQNVENIEVRLRSKDRKQEVRAVMQCYVGGGNDVSEERCEWLGERSVVWVRKVRRSEEEEEAMGRRWMMNAKSFASIGANIDDAINDAKTWGTNVVNAIKNVP